LTDHPTWVGVFLGVIAFTALLQAAFVIGLAVTSRTAHRRLREVEERLEPQIAAGLDKVARLTSAVSAASEQARVRAIRLDATAARLAADLGELVGTGATHVEGMAGTTAENLAARLAAPSEAGRRPFLRALALMKGLRRGLAVWRGDDGS
jgi:type IV pilus biogenesis protein CpaD/CtpE